MQLDFRLYSLMSHRQQCILVLTGRSSLRCSCRVLGWLFNLRNLWYGGLKHVILSYIYVVDILKHQRLSKASFRCIAMEMTTISSLLILILTCCTLFCPTSFMMHRDEEEMSSRLQHRFLSMEDMYEQSRSQSRQKNSGSLHGRERNEAISG